MCAVTNVHQDIKKLLVEDINLPDEIADVIIKDKTDMERQDEMQKGRECVRRLCDFYTTVKALFTSPGEWDINTLEELCTMVDELSGFSHLIKEDWFRQHHRTIFNKLLKDVQESSCEYATSCILRSGTISEGQRKFIDLINHNLLKPLSNMRRLAGVCAPYHPGRHYGLGGW